MSGRGNSEENLFFLGISVSLVIREWQKNIHIVEISYIGSDYISRKLIYVRKVRKHVGTSTKHMWRIIVIITDASSSFSQMDIPS